MMKYKMGIEHSVLDIGYWKLKTGEYPITNIRHGRTGGMSNDEV